MCRGNVAAAGKALAMAFTMALAKAMAYTARQIGRRSTCKAPPHPAQPGIAVSHSQTERGTPGGDPLGVGREHGTKARPWS